MSTNICIGPSELNFTPSVSEMFCRAEPLCSAVPEAVASRLRFTLASHPIHRIPRPNSAGLSIFDLIPLVGCASSAGATSAAQVCVGPSQAQLLGNRVRLEGHEVVLPFLAPFRERWVFAICQQINWCPPSPEPCPISRDDRSPVFRAMDWVSGSENSQHELRVSLRGAQGAFLCYLNALQDCSWEGMQEIYTARNIMEALDADGGYVDFGFAPPVRLP